MPKFYSRSYNNSPESGYVLTSDINGLVSWTASTSGLATASVGSLGGVIVGSGLTVSNSGVLSLSGGSTTYAAGTGLTLSGSTFSLVSVNTKRIYISVNGSDSNDGLTDATPFLNIKTGRDLAVSGDTVIVMPGTYVYDNRTSNGNYWNSRVADINLWKNGVTYYFEPGSKIIIYNQTVVGVNIYLFRPPGVVFETCNIYGYLEYEQYCAGADTSNGLIFFLFAETTNSVDVGFSSYIQVKSVYSSSNNTLVFVRKSAATGTASVTLCADSYIHSHIAGQSGWGYAIFILGSSTARTEYNQIIRFIKLTQPVGENLSGFNFLGDLSYTHINIVSDTLLSTLNDTIYNIRPTTTVISPVNDTGIINIDIKKTYFVGQPENKGAVVTNHAGSTTSITLNFKGDCIEYNQSGNAKTLFYLTGSGSVSRVINYTGNIYTITASGETSQGLYSQGRRIAYSEGINSIINIDGDINYNGPLVTLRETFKTASNGIINYTGNIRGNFGCPITKCNSGEINIYNSTIISDIDSLSSSIISNGFNYIAGNGTLPSSFTTGKIKISNSYIKLRNSGNYIGNGGYINTMISNSTIINSGTAGYGIINSAPYYADTMTNGWTSDSTSTGILQMSNSSIIVSATTSSIYYTGSASVISTNYSTNASWLVDSGLIGSVDLITELQY